MKPLTFLVLLAICVSMAPLNAQAQLVTPNEAQALRDFRRSGGPNSLSTLAQLREDRGAWSQAASSWRWLKKHYGREKRQTDSSAPAYTWAQLADFHLHRLARKRNLKAKPPRMTAQLRRRIAEAALKFGNQPPVAQLDFAAQADLDGDLVDEIVFLGSNGPLGRRKRDQMGIARWNGRDYRVVWQTTRDIPFMVHVADEDGDGWKEVFLGYEPETDNAATLFFNGQSVVFW